MSILIHLSVNKNSIYAITATYSMRAFTHTQKVCISDRIDCPCMWCIAYRNVNLIKMQFNSNSKFSAPKSESFLFWVFN